MANFSADDYFLDIGYGNCLLRQADQDENLKLWEMCQNLKGHKKEV